MVLSAFGDARALWVHLRVSGAFRSETRSGDCGIVLDKSLGGQHPIGHSCVYVAAT